MSETSECVAGDRKDFWKLQLTDQVMSQYVTTALYVVEVLGLK